MAEKKLRKSRKSAALANPLDQAVLSVKLKEIEDQQATLEMEKMSIMQKAMISGSPADMLRASNEIAAINKKQHDGTRQTYTFDPFNSNTTQGYKESPTNITDGFLRGMARTPFIRAIIDTRQNQLSNFSRPTSDLSVEGWTIKKKADMFNTDKATEFDEKDKTIISGIANFILNCGITDGGDKYDRYKRTTFESFLRETCRDSLTLDNLTFECLQNRRGDMTGFVSVDGATMRYTDELQYYDEDGKIKPEVLQYGQHPMYAQIYNQRIVSAFYSWEICMGIRNKSTDITQNGYGVSELEDLIRIVTWMLYGDQYNGKFFSQGAAPKGILKVQGNVNQDKLNEFRMYWQSMVTGVNNAWRTPVLESDKIEWIDLQKSNQDMQFSNWSEYLIRIACAVFKIDSYEMGFMFKGSGGKGGEQNTSHKQRTDYSKDKGLMPLMRFYEEIINKYIVQRLTDKYEFAWTGLSQEDEAAAVDLDVKKIANWMTVNEVRAKYKLKPIEGGDIILSPVMQQAKMAEMMGNPNSNAAVANEEESNDEDGNPYVTSTDSNPFAKGAFDELNDWIKEGMPNTLERIRK